MYSLEMNLKQKKHSMASCAYFCLDLSGRLLNLRSIRRWKRSSACMASCTFRAGTALHIFL